jgi:cation:H+ antiporter
VVVGIALLLAGGHYLVDSAVAIARHFGVSELVIAMTLISIGTSVPELATSIVAAVRRQGDISIGNVIGSNTFNLLGVLGLSAVIRPIPVPPHVRSFDMAWMIIFAIFTFVFLRTGRKLSRWEGGVLLASYCIFLALVVAR